MTISRSEVVLADGNSQAPIALDDTYGVHADLPLIVNGPGVLSNDGDPDGDALSVQVVTGPANGTLWLGTDGSFTYIPNPGFAGGDSFTYVANDGSLDSNPGVVTLSMHAQNTAPNARDGQYTILHDTTLNADNIDRGGILNDDDDPDGDPLTAALQTAPQHGNVQLFADGTFIYTPEPESVGSDSFTYVSNDGLADSTIATVTIEVTNAVPSAVDDNYQVPHDQALAVDAGSGVLANDSEGDGDPLSVTLVDAPVNGTLMLNPDGSFTYLLTTVRFLPDFFTYRIDDGPSESNLAKVTLDVTNQPPQSSDDFYSTAAGTPLFVDPPGVLANDFDPDNDPLTANLVTGPANGTLSLNADGSFTYTPNDQFLGADTFTYQAYDGIAFGNVATATISVLAAEPDTTVSIEATVPDTYEGLDLPGEFTVTRLGSMTEDLLVAYRLSGSATNGLDYASLSGTVTILAGSDTAKITVDALTDEEQEGIENVIVTLIPGETYSVAGSGTGTVNIAEPVFDLDVNNDKRLDAPVDRAKNYLPGYRGNTNWLSTGTTFNTARYTGQRMNLVVEAKGIGNMGLTAVEFKILEVTSYAGYAENATDDKIMGQGKEKDYSFSENQDLDTFTVTPEMTEAQGGQIETDRIWVNFWAKDFGGKAKVQVTLKKGDQTVGTFTLDVPLDMDADKIADKWEKQMVEKWNQQYGTSETVGNAFFGANDDKEMKDPDGQGTLVEQKTVGDHIGVLPEYRGFILDGGGFDGAGRNAPRGGHIRLSPARKEGLLEIDRRKDLANLPAGGIPDYLNAAARIWSHATRGAGNYIYYIQEHVNLPFPDFLPNDLRQTVLDKQRAYLSEHRGKEQAPGFPNDKLKRYFTHFVILSDVTDVHRVGAGWVHDEKAPEIDQRGIYLLTKEVHNQAELMRRIDAGVTDTDLGGIVAAHEYMHMVIAPQRPTATWDEKEHLVGNPGGNALMAAQPDPRTTKESTIVINATTQWEIGFAGNPALAP